MRAVAYLRIVPFLIALVVPVPLMLRPSAVAASNDQRTLAPMPALSFDSKFPGLFDAYLRDHFGGRQRLIRWNNRLKFNLFRESPVEGVILGRNGWLFYSHPRDGLDIRNFAGRWPHNAADVEAWLNRQDAREREYAALGARYLIAIAPDKQSVYPDLVPYRYGPHAPGVLDEVLARLEFHPRLRVLDLRPVLLAHRDMALYYKGDSHWNNRAAFRAAGAIADAVRDGLPTIAPLRESDYDVRETPANRGDLVNMLGLDLTVPDRQYLYVRRGPWARIVQNLPGNTTYEKAGPMPKAVLIGDSFGVGIEGILADAFSRLHYYMSTVNPPYPTLVREERPDVVILILVERNLHRLADQ